MKKTVLITGTSSGIGRAATKMFAANDWNVIATMRNPEKEKELNLMQNVYVTELDVAKKESIIAAIDGGISIFGQIDVLINNAGQGLFGAFEATPEEAIRKMFEVNLFGIMNTTKAILPYFRKQKCGVIVNVSSSTGLFTIPLMSVYSASKYALEGFSESLSYELSAHNIKVKIIEPGMVETNFDDATQRNYVSDPDITAYQEYMGKVIKVLSSEDPGESKVTVDEAATVILDAVTDGRDILRYLIGTDVKALTEARSSMSDKEYMDMMWKRFMV